VPSPGDPFRRGAPVYCSAPLRSVLVDRPRAVVTCETGNLARDGAIACRRDRRNRVSAVGRQVEGLCTTLIRPSSTGAA